MTAKTSATRREAFFKALAETGNQTIAAERDEAGEDVPRTYSTLSGGQGGLHSLFRAAGYRSTAPPIPPSRRGWRWQSRRRGRGLRAVALPSLPLSLAPNGAISMARSWSCAAMAVVGRAWGEGPPLRQDPAVPESFDQQEGGKG